MQRKHQRHPDRLQKYNDLKAQGFTDRAIAEQFGISGNSLHSWKANHVGVDLKRQAWEVPVVSSAGRTRVMRFNVPPAGKLPPVVQQMVKTYYWIVLQYQETEVQGYATDRLIRACWRWYFLKKEGDPKAYIKGCMRGVRYQPYQVKKRETRYHDERKYN